jgi:biopolymer transport protein TolQ
MSDRFSILALVVDASWIVKIILLLLLAASVFSWTVMFRRREVFREMRRRNEAFEKRFWGGGDLAQLYREITQRKEPAEGEEAIFEAGFREYARLRKLAVPGPQALEAARRAMLAARLREIDRLEHQLPFLATLGSTGPYVGLFGTVWGIMTAFHALGNVAQATISMVAPGISQALVATAMGLFAAIPAVVGYNRFSSELARHETRFEMFVEEFSGILQRSSFAAAPAAAGEGGGA